MRKTKILFLEGPASPFLRVTADLCESAGAEIHAFLFCLGDAIFWLPRRATWFRGRRESWPGVLDAYLRHNAITDIIMLGDGRPVHASAVETALRHDVRIHILEHGYLRPDWLTLEPDGMSSRSRFPRDAATIKALAKDAPEPDVPKRYRAPYLTYAFYDLAYHIPNVLFGWLFHPHYRTHGPVHPLVEYAGVIGKAFTARRRRRETQATLRHFIGEGRLPPYFLFPLQLPGDYQIRNDAPGGDMLKIAQATIRSFAAFAPAGTRLLFKVHPIDNGLQDWARHLNDAARAAGVEDRIALVDGGNLDTMISGATGVVTVNSTVGLTALAAGRPVVTLGAAIYDIEGLTHQAPLATFWMQPTLPDEMLMTAFRRALASTIQLRGGFIGAEAIKDGARAVAARLMSGDDPLPGHGRGPKSGPVFRYETELFGKTSPDKN